MRVISIWASVLIGGSLLLVLAVGGAEEMYARLYHNRIFPGARVLGVRLDGLSISEARKAIQNAIDAALAEGLRFEYRGREIVLDASTVSTDPDVSRDLIRYNFDGVLERAFALGREGPWQERVTRQIRLRTVPFHLPVVITIDRAQIADALHTALRRELPRAHDARFVFDMTARPSRVLIEPEQSGVTLVIEPALTRLLAQAERLDFRTIAVDDHITLPRVTQTDIEPLFPHAHAWTQRPSITFVYDAQRFVIPTALFSSWMAVTGTQGNFKLTIDPQKFEVDVRNVAGSIEQEAKDGSLEIKDKKVISFVSGTQGRRIDIQATLNTVLAHWPASSTIPIVVRVSQGRLTGIDPEALGIRELLGVGTSGFSGSPVNRRKNIAHGVAQVNGTIIQPGETFSLLKTLGPVDGAHQWLPELVIKGNVTKPEYGGGLCQIGTTTFRGALASGLPIVERQNHSYRVRYYEPAGTDATIYEPKPDFRFLNDTGYPIVIHAYIKGNDVFFEFWGTKDGRVVEQTKPSIFNVTPPPPMKLIETLELPPGKKKCTETAHAGADAQFTYTVTYQNSDVKKTVFRSHYRPWQAVCLVGVEKLSQPIEETIGTSPESSAGN